MEKPTLLVQAGRLFVIFMGPSLGGLVPLALAIAQPAIGAHFGGGEHGTLLARLLFSLPSLMIIVGTSLGGYVSTRFGPRPSLLIALAVYGLTGGAGLVLDDFASLLATRLILGVAGGAVMTIYLSLTAHYYEGQARARVLGFAVACSSLAGLLSLAVGGRLVDWGGWRAPFGLYLLALLVLPVAWRVIRLPRAAAEGPRPAMSLLGILHVIGRFWPVYSVLIILSIGTFMPSAGGPFLLREHHILKGGAQGLILSIGSSTAIVTAIAYGFFRRYLTDRVILAITAGAMGLGLVAAVPFDIPALLLIAFAIAGIGTGFKAPAASSLLLAEAPPELRAEAAGLGLSSIFIGQFLAPMVMQTLDGAIRIQGSFYVVGGALLLVSLAVSMGAIGPSESRSSRSAEKIETRLTR